jgi:hypothetical protein
MALRCLVGAQAGPPVPNRNAACRPRRCPRRPRTPHLLRPFRRRRSLRKSLRQRPKSPRRAARERLHPRPSRLRRNRYESVRNGRAIEPIVSGALPTNATRLSTAIATGGVLWFLQSSFWASLLLLGLPIWRHVDLLAIVARTPDDEAGERQTPFNPSEDEPVSRVLDDGRNPHLQRVPS